MRLSIAKALFGVLVLGAFSAGGCGGPRVKQSVIPRSVIEVTAWDIRWAGENDTSSAATVPFEKGLIKSKAQTDFCQAYIEAVRHYLIADHHISFAENFPQRGLIELDINSKTISEYTPPDTAAEERFRGGPGKDTYPHGSPWSSDALLGLGDVLFGQRVRVDSLVVRFFEPGGKPAGWAAIASENVRPPEAAEVISDLITTGRYKGSAIQVDLGLSSD
ncbi:MAG: hypothetical protein ABIE70_10595 [bacterium]